MMKAWFSGTKKVAFRCKEAVSLWVFAAMAGFGAGVLSSLMKTLAFAAFTCILALGGAIVGTITGAIKGQTTETGFLRGAGIGAVAGAITAIQLLESIINGESLSKVGLLVSLVNGKVFLEWVSPAVLKAYQWQISELETNYREISDVYETTGAKGLSQNCIQKLPNNILHGSMIELCHEFSCSICLQDFKEGDSARRLPNCGHLFHLECIDAWLIRNGACPMCRKEVCNDN